LGKAAASSIEPPVVSLWDNLSVSARRYPKKTALAFFDCCITYEELAGAAERLAAQLAVFGVRRGDRVLVVMQNCPQLVIAHYAIFRANAVVVPVNPMNRAEELRHYITDAQATIAITTGDLAAELAAASNGIEGAANLRHLIVTQFADVIDLSWNAGVVPPHWFAWLSERHPLPSLVGTEVHRWQDLRRERRATGSCADRDDLALPPYTSGTTGSPKGCMESGKSVMHNAMTMSFWLDGTPKWWAWPCCRFFTLRAWSA
jgi:fatty-acyl-CoA synthase